MVSSVLTANILENFRNIKGDEMAMPKRFDLKENIAFETWANSNQMDTRQCPESGRFLCSETRAARFAWLASIDYCREQVSVESDDLNKSESSGV